MHLKSGLTHPKNKTNNGNNINKNPQENSGIAKFYHNTNEDVRENYGISGIVEYTEKRRKE